VAKDLSIGGELGVDPGSAEEVQGDEALGEQPIPQVEREVGGQAAEASNQMIFEGADGPFGRVPAVDARWYQLVLDANGRHVSFEYVRAFVVEPLE